MMVDCPHCGRDHPNFEGVNDCALTAWATYPQTPEFREPAAALDLGTKAFQRAMELCYPPEGVLMDAPVQAQGELMTYDCARDLRRRLRTWMGEVHACEDSQ